ncbi:homoserine O-succinyltransferase [Pikeienuella piscinae]|uniref:Homoserine O-acetyltransferase n=1 Tax=Pikeienuella piscinae TaxID=2748098 RepID=A0A7L5BSI9_9RHOB|nr:homoserine O-succinyltransferase [Pikeienuella piscinae]QIE54005.1 homoserine O-succinyltransferase [Pikeienuella piscinae]
MPIKIPADLPARDVLTREGVMVMSEDDAARQDIRPLQIALLNLMPKKVQTETQLARVIGAGPLQIELTLIRMTEHESRHTPAEHMRAFYQPFAKARERKFDGLIITGAPIEHLPFEEVSYWRELQEVFEWTRSHVHSTFAICWGGQAMLRHFYGVPKHDLGAKLFGCFEQEVARPGSPYLTGFADRFVAPVSRWTEVREDDVTKHGVEILAASPLSGICLLRDEALNALFMFNHLEYDADTLKQEYDRDVIAGTPITIPANYYPEDDPSRPPRNTWRSHGHLLYGNWINQIYQTTPFEVDRIGG